MSKKTKGQEFIDEFDAGENDDIYEFLKQIQSISSGESLNKLISNQGIKMEWKDEDN